MTLYDFIETFKLVSVRNTFELFGGEKRKKKQVSNFTLKMATVAGNRQLKRQ